MCMQSDGSMQYRSSNANLDSGCQTMSIVTGDNVGHSTGALSCSNVFLTTVVTCLCLRLLAYVYLHYSQNIRTIIMLTLGIMNVFCNVYTQLRYANNRIVNIKKGTTCN